MNAITDVWRGMVMYLESNTNKTCLKCLLEAQRDLC